MTRDGFDTDLAASLSASLRADLAGDDRALSGVVPVLSHLLAFPGEALVSDDVIARMRGLIGGIARQFPAPDGEDAAAAKDGASAGAVDSLAATLAGNGGLMMHCYGLAVEGALTLKLSDTQGLDPVMSALLKELIASKDDTIAELAMQFMASQSRFAEGQRRVDTPILELPPWLFDEAVNIWKAWASGQQIANIAAVETELRGQYDEGRTRHSLLERLLGTLGASADVVCEIETAGLAIFASAIARGTQQPRELIILSCQMQQNLRLALALKSCALTAEAIARQFAFLGHDIALPEGFDAWDDDDAAQLLANSSLSAKVEHNG